MELELSDYIKMHDQIYTEEIDYGPNASVRVYGDEGEQVDLTFWYSPEDQPIVEECLKEGERPFFVKAYSGETGRDGVNVQTGDKMDFRHLGYGHSSTAALRRLFAMNANGWTLQLLEDRKIEIVCKDDNPLNLRRHNLGIVDRQHRGREYNLAAAKILVEKREL